MDGIIGMKYNRQEIARVEDVKKGVQNATKKDFKDGYLRQIRCVSCPVICFRGCNFLTLKMRLPDRLRLHLGASNR